MENYTAKNGDYIMINRKYLGNDMEGQPEEQRKDLKTNRCMCKSIISQLHWIKRLSPTLIMLTNLTIIEYQIL